MIANDISIIIQSLENAEVFDKQTEEKKKKRMSFVIIDCRNMVIISRT